MNYNIPDNNTIGGFNYSWDFDEDEYQDWLLDEELDDTPQNREQYINDCVKFECSYVDHETFHSTGDYAEFSYDELIDQYGERVAKEIRDDLEKFGKQEGFMDKMSLFDDEFDINKLRYGKVIIMADADVDGSHIRTLLLTFFFRFMRPLIENGNICIAQPPLYRITRKKVEMDAYTEEDKDRIVRELGGTATVKKVKEEGDA